MTLNTKFNINDIVWGFYPDTLSIKEVEVLGYSFNFEGATAEQQNEIIYTCTDKETRAYIAQYGGDIGYRFYAEKYLFATEEEAIACKEAYQAALSGTTEESGTTEITENIEDSGTTETNE